MLSQLVGAVRRWNTLRQFIKFCLIGASSAVIDVGLLNVLTQLAHWHWVVAQIASFSLAVTNGFIWNSLWTFRGIQGASNRTRYARFYATNVIGLLLNIVVMKAVMFLLTGKLIHPGNPSPLVLNAAKAVAIVVVAFWNFGASKYWTFRPQSRPAMGSSSPSEGETPAT